MYVHSVFTDEIERLLLHAVVGVSFLTSSVWPAPALAAAETHKDVHFVRDDQLAHEAIVGYEVFGRGTGRGVARDSALQIPVTGPQLYVGATFKVVASAYSSTVGQTDADPFTTASGTQVSAGTLAANWLPFGTSVKVNGRIYVVEDRMNSRFNDVYVIDLWMPSTPAARSFGVQGAVLQIISLPSDR